MIFLGGQVLEENLFIIIFLILQILQIFMEKSKMRK